MARIHQEIEMKKVTTVIFLLSGVLFVGCSGTSDDKAEAGEVQAELTASTETLARYGIGKWEVFPAGQDTVRFVGRAKDGQDLAQIQVRSVSESSARVALLKPEAAEADVDGNGVFVGDVSASARALLQALYADTAAAKGVNAVPASEPDSIGTSQQALSIGYQGHIPYWGGWFGYRDNYNVGGWCPNGGTRSFADAYSNNGASCWVNRWASSQVNDCTINLHLGINAFASDICNWYAYQSP
jgi:hypothetical protein